MKIRLLIGLVLVFMSFYSIGPVTCDEFFQNACQRLFHYTEHYYTVLPFFVPMLAVGIILIWKRENEN